jgi:Family of unknown function (DUF695)
MAWRTALLNFDGKPGHTMVDDRFADNPPVDQLPHLAWFGVYCATPPGDHFWNADEGPQLDAVEDDLIKLCDQHGDGWAAYVHRLDTAGLREYYIYFGEGASIDKVLPELKAAHPSYRLEYDRIDDLKWAQYRKWLGWAATGDNPRMQRTGAAGIFSSVRKWFGRGSGR